MPNRDLTAPSSQAKSQISEDAQAVGERLYGEIVDDGSPHALAKLKKLAAASERMEGAVEVNGTLRPPRLKRWLAFASAIVSR